MPQQSNEDQKTSIVRHINIVNHGGTVQLDNKAAQTVTMSQSQQNSYIVSVFADKHKAIAFLVLAWLATILAGALGNILSDLILTYLKPK